MKWSLLFKRSFPTRAYVTLAILDVLGLVALVAGLQKDSKALIIAGIILSAPFLAIVPLLIVNARRRDR